MKNVKELAVMIFTASFLTLSLTACFGGGASKNSDITRVVLSGGGMSRSDRYSYSMFVEDGEPKISAWYFDEELGEYVDSPALTIDWIEWISVKDMIFEADLKKYKKPLISPRDYSANTISVTWEKNGREKQIEYADSLPELRPLAEEILLFAKENADRPKNQAVSGEAVLNSFEWLSSSTVFYQCFSISAGSETHELYIEEPNPDDRYFNCILNSENGDEIEIIDALMTAEQWKRLEERLHEFILSEPSEYTPPSRFLLDADSSCIYVSWTDNGERITNRYNGGGEQELLSFLYDLAFEIKENNTESKNN